VTAIFCALTRITGEGYMLCALGKELRKIRIERGELLLDMANRIGIRPALLSGIENGNCPRNVGF